MTPSQAPRAPASASVPPLEKASADMLASEKRHTPAEMAAASLKEAANAHVKAIGGMDAKGVLSQSDFSAINTGLGKAIASVPTSKVMDVYNAMAKVTGDTGVVNKLYSTVNPADALTKYLDQAGVKRYLSSSGHRVVEGRALKGIKLQEGSEGRELC